jgi:hypothetical protein
LDLVPHRAVDLFQHPWYDNHRGRSDELDVFADGLDRLGIGNRAARHQRAVVPAGALEHVAQGQERHQHVILIDAEPAYRGLGVGEDVAMRQHRALRLAGCARGVADREQVVRLGFVRFGEFRVPLQRLGPGLAEFLEAE